MKQLAFLGLGLLVIASGCKDLPGRSPQTPTEATRVESSLSAGADNRGSAIAEGTLCASYRVRLAEYRAALAGNDKADDLVDQISTFEALVENACD